MKNLTLYKIFAILFVAISFSSCVKDGDFVIPTAGEDKEYKNLVPLSDIVALYKGSNIDFNDYIKDNNLEDINTYGYVISDDREGNFYKKLIIQDKAENPTVGVEVRVDATNLSAVYNVGRKVYIKLKGLAFGKFFSSYQIGASNSGKVDRIELSEYRNHIERSSEIAEIVPKTLTIGELSQNLINTLVKIDDLQSEVKGLQYASPETNSYITRTLASCKTFEKIELSNSKFVNFKQHSIPDFKGSVTAVLSEFSSKYQLIMRDTEDVNFTQEYGCFNNPTLKSLADIKALFTGNETTITESYKIKVVITSDLAKGNISNRNAFAQDGATAIALRFSEAYNLNIGDEVEISVGGTKLSEYNGLLQLNLSNSNIISKAAGTLPTPEVITFTQALTGNYESKLVTIEGVQFKDITKTYSGSNTLTSDCTNTLTTFVRTDAAFATTNVSDKKGSVTGIMSDFNGPQIYLRDASDVNFTEAYACTSTGGAPKANDLFISEYVEGSSNNKYIEIYNGTGAAVDLSKYQVWGSSNGGGWKAARQLQLSGTLATGDVYVISTNQAVAAIQDEADLKLPYESPVHHNGDDAIGLAKDNGSGTYELIDVIGTPDSDPGSGWEVAGVSNATKDRTLIRKISIIEGNTSWSASAGTDTANSEWEVKNKDDFSSVGKR